MKSLEDVCKVNAELRDRIDLISKDAAKRIADCWKKNILLKEALEDIAEAAIKGDETTTELECYHLATDALQSIGRREGTDSE